MAPPKLVFVTGNAHKLRDVREILGDAFEVESANLDIPELQGTVEEIAIDKCRKAADILQGPVLVEDTSLSFNAMGQMPGPYIKWFLEELGQENLYKMLVGFEDKSATVNCVFAYSGGQGQEPVLFQAQTLGKIVPPRGPAIFGWNPAFEYNGRTFAEMTIEEKNKFSGRGRALRKLQAWLLDGTK